MIKMIPQSSDIAATLCEISRAVGVDIRDFDTAKALSDTVAAQLALYAVGVAYARLLAADGIFPDVVAGHSIGAFAAAVTVGVLTVEEGARAVKIRAEGMRELYPSGFGLLALLGTRVANARRLVTQVGDGRDLFVAMENAEDQIVLAGSDAAFDRVFASAASFGVREVRRLDVAVPAHCPLMDPVGRSVAAELATLPSRAPTARYLSAMTARSALTSEAVKLDLAGGVAHMVRWRDTTEVLSELGATNVIQLPPGHVTAALFSSSHPGVPVVALDDAAYKDSIERIRRIRHPA